MSKKKPFNPVQIPQEVTNMNNAPSSHDDMIIIPASATIHRTPNGVDFPDAVQFAPSIPTGRLTLIFEDRTAGRRKPNSAPTFTAFIAGQKVLLATTMSNGDPLMISDSTSVLVARGSFQSPGVFVADEIPQAIYPVLTIPQGGNVPPFKTVVFTKDGKMRPPIPRIGWEQSKKILAVLSGDDERSPFFSVKNTGDITFSPRYQGDSVVFFTDSGVTGYDGDNAEMSDHDVHVMVGKLPPPVKNWISKIYDDKFYGLARAFPFATAEPTFDSEKRRTIAGVFGLPKFIPDYENREDHLMVFFDEVKNADEYNRKRSALVGKLKQAAPDRVWLITREPNGTGTAIMVLSSHNSVELTESMVLDAITREPKAIQVVIEHDNQIHAIRMNPNVGSCMIDSTAAFKAVVLRPIFSGPRPLAAAGKMKKGAPSIIGSVTAASIPSLEDESDEEVVPVSIDALPDEESVEEELLNESDDESENQ